MSHRPRRPVQLPQQRRLVPAGRNDYLHPRWNRSVLRRPGHSHRIDADLSVRCTAREYGEPRAPRDLDVDQITATTKWISAFSSLVLFVVLVCQINHETDQPRENQNAIGFFVVGFVRGSRLTDQPRNGSTTRKDQPRETKCDSLFVVVLV